MKLACAWLCSILALCAAQADGPAAPDPEAWGPYPVGVTTVQLVDHARIDPENENAPRAMQTEVWYPAVEFARDLPLNKHSDFYLKGKNAALNGALKMAFKVDMAAIDAAWDNKAHRDVPVADDAFPLVMFSHGNGGMRMQSVFWCEFVASHGYVVVSPDHTGNCAITTVDGNLVPYDNDGRERAAEDRPKDISFLIDAMDKWNKGGDSRFIGKLDLEHVAVAGHSFGGYTATRCADLDDRVDAIIPMAAVANERTDYETPCLMFIATEDRTIKAEGNARMRTYFEQSKGPKVLVEFKNAGHYSFTEMFQYNPTFGDGVGEGKRITDDGPLKYVDKSTLYRYTNAYSVAFLGKFLRGQTDYGAYLATNHKPEEINYQNAD